jgi:hypothetical protein
MTPSGRNSWTTCSVSCRSGVSPSSVFAAAIKIQVYITFTVTARYFCFAVRETETKSHILRVRFFVSPSRVSSVLKFGTHPYATVWFVRL